MAALASQQSLRDLIYAWRDRLLADRRFQRWAAAFPLTRPMARRKTRELFDLVAGFVYAQVLAACVELRLFDHLAQGPRDLADLAPLLKLDEAAAMRLLEAAVSVKLVAKRGNNRYGLGDLGAALRADPAISAMVAHHRLFYADLADPVALLRGESRPSQLQQFWSYVGESQTGSVSADEAVAYSALMGASQSFIADDVLDAYAVGRHQCLLDIGGGDGTFLRAAAARAPGLKLHLFDVPAVVDEGRKRFSEVGLADRAELTGGSFREDPLPGGADLISVVRVAYDHDDPVVLALYTKVYTALSPGGRLLIAEPMAGTPGAEAAGAAYFGFYTLAMGTGRPRTVAEHRALLAAAGFSRVQVLRNGNPLLTRVLIASR